MVNDSRTARMPGKHRTFFGRKMKTVAIIPAGGTGVRMGGNIPKQYLKLGGIPIIVHTLMAFQEARLVDAIFLVLPKEDVAEAPQIVLSRYRLPKVQQILPGGAHRQDSVKQGLDALPSDCDIVVIHDAVRPFISPQIINTIIRKASLSGAVTVGMPIRDTIKRVDGRGCVEATVDRERLWCTQTPQAFRAPLLKEAYETAYGEHHYGTDDAGLVERTGIKVKMLPGSFDNIKITTADDLAWGELILEMKRGKRGSKNIKNSDRAR